jgi:hypothetical protein
MAARFDFSTGGEMLRDSSPAILAGFRGQPGLAAFNSMFAALGEAGLSQHLLLRIVYFLLSNEAICRNGAIM